METTIERQVFVIEQCDMQHEKSRDKTDDMVDRLFVSYKNDVFRFALLLVGDYQLAEDVTQDVFIKALESLVNLRDRGKVKTWLLSITRNTALNLIRRRGFETAGEEEFFSGIPHTDASNLEFYDMLACLDRDGQQIVTLHIVNGLKHREIASVLDMQPAAVRKRYARALETIKNSLEGGGYYE